MSRPGVIAGQALLIMLPALTAGCVKPPPRHDLSAVATAPPDAWAGAGQASPEPVVADAWWSQFGDARVDEIVRGALAANHDLRAAAARLEQAAAAARIVSADLKPVLGVGLDASRQRQNFVGLPIPGSGNVLSTTYDRFGVGLDVLWEVDLWGRLRAGARAALAEVQASAAELESARQSLAAQAVKAWFAVVEARMQVDLSAATVASRLDSAEQIETRYRMGLRPPLELRLARSTLADAEAVLSRRRSQLGSAVRQLEILLARYPSGRLPEAEAVGELPAAPPPVPAGLPSELLQRRPDLMAAERRVAAADERSRSARRALYPRLTLTGSGGTVSDQLQDLVDGDFRVWSLLGSLTQPLFQGGRLRAGVVRADAVGDEALERYASDVLAAFGEVEAALADESYLAGQERALADSAASLTAARALAEDRYRQGVGDYLSLLESQGREFTARSALLAVRRQRLTNRVDLHLALGGGFDAGSPLVAAGSMPETEKEGEQP